jgi:hypothetical protein
MKQAEAGFEALPYNTQIVRFCSGIGAPSFQNATQSLGMTCDKHAPLLFHLLRHHAIRSKSCKRVRFQPESEDCVARGEAKGRASTENSHDISFSRKVALEKHASLAKLAEQDVMGSSHRLCSTSVLVRLESQWHWASRCLEKPRLIWGVRNPILREERVN